MPENEGNGGTGQPAAKRGLWGWVKASWGWIAGACIAFSGFIALLANGNEARSFVCSIWSDLPFCQQDDQPPPPPPPMQACAQPEFASYCGQFSTPAVRATFEDAFASFLQETGHLNCRGDTVTAWLFDGELQLGVKSTRLSNCPEFYSRPLPSRTTALDHYQFLRRGDRVSPRTMNESPILPGEVVEYIDVACFNEYEAPLNFIRMPADALQDAQSTFTGEVNVRSSDLLTSTVAANLLGFTMSKQNGAPVIDAAGEIHPLDAQTSQLVAITRTIDAAWGAAEAGGSERCSPNNLRAALRRLSEGQTSGLLSLSFPATPADHEVMVLLRRHPLAPAPSTPPQPAP